MRMLMSTENIRIEPSNCATFIGPAKLLQYEDSVQYLKKQGIDENILNNVNHICWATGGKLVPEEIWKEYLDTELPV